MALETLEQRQAAAERLRAHHERNLAAIAEEDEAQSRLKARTARPGDGDGEGVLVGDADGSVTRRKAGAGPSRNMARTGPSADKGGELRFASDEAEAAAANVDPQALRAVAGSGKDGALTVADVRQAAGDSE